MQVLITEIMSSYELMRRASTSSPTLPALKHQSLGNSGPMLRKEVSAWFKIRDRVSKLLLCNVSTVKATT